MVHQLRSGKLLYIFLFAGIYTNAKGQENQPGFDRSLYHFGMVFGGGTSSFRLDRSDWFLRNDTISSVICQPRANFKFGLVSDLHLGEYFDIRLAPNFLFAQRDIYYTFRNGN